jgi:hypothetical protein
MSSYFFFDPPYLSDLSEKLAGDYQDATPFPHVVIDNFFPDVQVLDDVLSEFPKPGSMDWVQYDQATEKKLASKAETQLGPATRHLLQQFNSPTFCAFLEKLTGIEGIIPDPYLWGGGLHQIEAGGYLKVHTDFNWYDKLKLDRRLNVLLYLNRDWAEGYGGHLELWTEDMSRCEKKILPVLNRCVIFSTTNSSYHGHPETLRCPPGETRKSLALYYYSNGRPEDEQRNYSTVFKPRPGEKFKIGAKGIARGLVPPLLLELVRRLRQSP